MIIDTSDEIVDLCARAVEDNNAEKRARIAAGETLTNAQKSKAVLVTYRRRLWCADRRSTVPRPPSVASVRDGGRL